MATTSSRRTSGVGGKIVKNRRLQRTTPYSRPSPLPPPPSSDDSQNPNWLSGLIYPAKFIASGAGKLLSFFGNDDDDDDDSSSSSGDDDSSDNEDNDEEIENDLSFQEDDRSDKVLSPSSKSDNKRAIEQLVIQETFTRKEANELIKLVRSRIVDTNASFGDTTNMRSTAIMEARKWLQDKRSGSKKKLEDELDFSSMASPSQISRNEKGSPVDMARSYMQNRPAWASPSLKHPEAGSSSPLGMLRFKDETPKSALRNSEHKRSSFSSGSWNLLEEIRRVRSKATEELLAAAPLAKTVLSPFSPESNPPQDFVMDKGAAEGAGAAESTHDRPDINFLDAAASTPSRVGQDGDAVQSAAQQESHEAAELKYENIDEVKKLESATEENGFGCSASGLAQGQDTTHEARPSENTHMEENSNPLEEPVVDLTTDDVIYASQNSSSLRQEDLSQDASHAVAVDGPAAKVKGTQNERKSRAGYSPRGRSRARGRSRGK